MNIHPHPAERDHDGSRPIPPRRAYNQDDATGFIRLSALRLKVAAKVQNGEDSEKSES